MQVGGCYTPSTFYPASNINFQRTHFGYAVFMIQNLTKTTKNLFLCHWRNTTFDTINIIIKSILKKKNIKIVKEKILL